MSWFETVSANLDTKVKCKALFACRKAAYAVITKEWCNVEEQIEVTHGHLGARRVEYCAETAGIICAEVPPPVNLLTMKPRIDRANWMIFKVAGISKNMVEGSSTISEKGDQ